MTTVEREPEARGPSARLKLASLELTHVNDSSQAQTTLQVNECELECAARRMELAHLVDRGAAAGFTSFALARPPFGVFQSVGHGEVGKGD
jgi:hypothetical protein